MELVLPFLALNLKCALPFVSVAMIVLLSITISFCGHNSDIEVCWCHSGSLFIWYPKGHSNMELLFFSNNHHFSHEMLLKRM